MGGMPQIDEIDVEISKIERPSNPKDPSLKNVKGYVEKVLQKRLKMYDAVDIEVTESGNPRKALKNAIVSYNGYYRLDFTSKKENTHYSCDVTYATNLDLDPYPYVMNCEPDTNGSLTPSYVKKLLLEEHPEIPPDSIEVSRDKLYNSLTTVMMIDDAKYDIQFADASGSIIDCEYKLEMRRQPNRLMDQYLEADSCTNTGRKFSPKIQPKQTFGVNCDPAVAEIEKLTTSLNPLYDDTNKKLESIRPMPKPQDVDCANKDPKYWRNFGDKVIDLSDFNLKSAPSSKVQNSRFPRALNPIDLEKAVLQNALINQAYNRLYVKSREGKPAGSVDSLQWLAVAAYSSPIVGKNLRASYSAHAGTATLQNSPGLARVVASDKAGYFDNSPLVGIAIVERPQVAVMTAQGNVNVFNDMYWQNFAAAYCGSGKTREIVKALYDEAEKRGNEVDKNHYDTLTKAWDLIERGSNKNPSDEQMIKDGNMLLLLAEQRDILQPQLYSSTAAKIVNKMGVFNEMAKTNFYDPSGSKIDSFSAYCSKKKMSCSLSDLDSRFRWMKHVVSRQLDYVKSTNGNGLTKSTYAPALEESYSVLSDYKHNAPTIQNKQK